MSAIKSQPGITPAPPADCQSKHHQKPTAACQIEFLEMRPHHETRVLRLCLGCAVDRAGRASTEMAS